MFPYGCDSTDYESNSSSDKGKDGESSQDVDEEREDDTLDEFGLGEKDRSYFCSAFTLIDTDGDGIISPRTMRNIIRGLGRECTEENMDEMKAYCTTTEALDGTAGMNFNGFYRYFGEQLIDTNNISELKNAFEVFDAVCPVSGSVLPGLTDLTEVRHNLKYRGMKLTDEEIDYLWDEQNNWMLEEKRIETIHLIKIIMDKL